MSGGAMLLTMLFALIALTIFRNAWVCDDAYISFRTADNFIHGYGLRFNIDERVQTFTNPLWVFVMAFFAKFGPGFFMTSIVVSLAFSMACVGLLARTSTRLSSAILILIGLLLSRAFIDYSTSGLENPAGHFFIALFGYLYFRRTVTPGLLFLLALVASGAALNRIDNVLLFLPCLFFCFLQSRSWKSVGMLALGFLPIALWLLFSLIYYGSPFPNTAYAKLNVEVSHLVLLKHAFGYIVNSLQCDPVTMLIVCLGVAVPIATRRRKAAALASGILLFFVYLAWIGGDHMSGRFLTSPLVLAAACLLGCDFMPDFDGPWQCSAIVLGVLGFCAVNPTLQFQPLYPKEDGIAHGSNGITDERSVWYQNASIAVYASYRHLPDDGNVDAGKSARARGEKYALVAALGYFAYFAGPQVHVIDDYALADALMSRIPATNYSAGHNKRHVPAGYKQTLVTGKNVIFDKGLAEFYNHLDRIIRGPIFTVQRFKDIWDFNTGRYRPLLEDYAKRCALGIADLDDHHFLLDTGCDEDATIYINNKKVELEKTSGYQATAIAALKPGDVITVKCLNTGGGYGFAMLAVNGKNQGTLATNLKDWKSYEPVNREEFWKNPTDGKVGPVQKASDEPFTHLISQRRDKQCLSIWGPNGNECYLYCQVTAASLMAKE